MIRTAKTLPPGWRLVTAAYDSSENDALRACAAGFVAAGQAPPEDVMIIRKSWRQNYVALRGPEKEKISDGKAKHTKGAGALKLHVALRRHGLVDEFKRLGRLYSGEGEIRAWIAGHPLLKDCAVPQSLRWNRIIFGVPAKHGGLRPSKERVKVLQLTAAGEG